MTVAAISDEMLMALADGELGQEDALALRARLARDHELAARYALFVETRALVQEPTGSLSSTASDPLAEAIMAMERGRAGGLPGHPDASRSRLGVIQGGAAVRDHGRPANVRRIGAVPRWSLPVAAALMFVIGNVTGYVLMPNLRPHGMSPTSDILVLPAAQAALDGALTRTASGQEVAWSDQASKASGRIVVISTHQLDDGTTCREYQVRMGDGSRGTVVGASCRRDGRWRTEIALTAPDAGSAYTPANGMTAVEDYLTNRGSSGPLAPESERALIDRGWRAQRD